MRLCSMTTFSTAKRSEHLPLSIWHFSAGTQMNGAVYSDLPIPQLKHARLKLSEASPFCASVLLSVPQSDFYTHLSPRLSFA